MAYTTINDPSAHFQADLYTGSGSAKTFDGNSDLQLDMVWIKARSTAENGRLADTSRGIGDGTNETKWLLPAETASEESSTEFASIGSDSFTLNTSDAKLNSSSHTYAAWAWKANGGTTTTNNAGANGADHASVYQANDTAGFSIVTYTSDNQSGDTTIKHGLSTAPTFMIHKARNASSTIWWVYHTGLGNSGYVQIDDTQANQTGSSNVWRNTAPTSSVFKVGLDSIAAADGRTMVAYCFAPIQGYSAFGTFTGSGSDLGSEQSDGAFVYTGFKPAWLMFKRTDSTSNWCLVDHKRLGYNPDIPEFRPNLANAEGNTTDDILDLVSNGFKIRTTSGDFGGGTGNFIYMAFAESPFVSSTGVPTTAR